MSVKPTQLSTDLDNKILSTVVQNTYVKEPIWINNQTRLNESNMNNLRNRLISYSDGTLKNTYTNLIQHLNTIINRTAGWNSFAPTDGGFTNPIGAVFNDFANNKAEGQFSAAFGRCTIANGEAQFVCGKYNEDKDALFIVGCGESDDKRSNALVVTVDGNVQLLKDVTFDGNETFNGTVIFNDTVNLENGFTSNKDSTVDGKLTVTKAPTAKTHVVRKKELDALRDEISGALHYIGVTDKIPTDQETIDIYEINDEGNFILKPRNVTDGDVVLVGQLDENGNIIYKDENGSPTTDGREYIYNGKTWTYYGAYANYVPKMEYEDQVKLFNQRIWGKDTTPTDGDTIVKQLLDEKDARTNADKAINKAAFGTEVTPSDIDDTSNDTNKHSLQKQLDTEIDNREKADEQITEAYKKADDELELKIIGNADDTVEDNTLNGVINYAVEEDKKITAAYTAKDAELQTDIDAINLALSYLADKDVIATEPSFRFSSSNVTTVEVGTNITPNFNITFDDGTYEYGPDPTGSKASGYEVTFNGESLTTSSGTFTAVHVTDSTSLTLSAKCTYTDGNTPKNNLGLDYVAGKIVGATKTITKTLKGFRQAFAGGLASKDTDIKKLDIRALTGKGATAKSFDVIIDKDTTRVVVAFPDSWGTLKTALDVNDSSKNIVTSFGTPETIEVSGATESQDLMNYKVYVMDFASAYGGSGNTYKITIG